MTIDGEMRIGEAANMIGCSKKRLVEYCDENLVAFRWTAGGQRKFMRFEIERFLKVRELAMKEQRA